MSASDTTSSRIEPAPEPASAEASEAAVVQGSCYALFAYDVALSIDLDHAQELITAIKQRGTIRHKRRAPYYFEYQPAPLRVTWSTEPIRVGAYATDAAVEAVVYDFGAVSVLYKIPLAGSLSGLLDLSEELWDHPQLLADSQRMVDMLLVSIAPAVSKQSISDRVEDYAIYEIESLARSQSLTQAIASHAGLLAQILRAERDPLSREEIDDALSCCISFGADDRTLIDWNASMIFDRDADDVRAVLEFANVELLEFRHLDDRLDAALNEAYEAAARRARRFVAFPGSKASDLWRIAELQTDSAQFYEGVSNALKLLGDQYLARVHRLVSQRFHLADWDRSVLRKLQTIESIYEKTSDRHAALRIEVLEWIIIILIAAEIILTLVLGRA